MPKCNKYLCIQRIPKLEQRLSSLSKPLGNTTDIFLSCKGLVDHDHQDIVVDIFARILLESKSEDAVLRFQVIDEILKQVGGKLSAEFEPLLPKICLRVRRLLEDAKDGKGVTDLVMLRVGWDKRFTQTTLDEVDFLLRQLGDWPRFTPCSGVAGTSTAKTMPKPNDNPRSQPVCTSTQPPNREDPIQTEMMRVHRVSSTHTQEQVLKSKRMRGFFKRYNKRQSLGTTKKESRRLSEGADSGIDSLGSLSPTETIVEQTRPEVPKRNFILRIKIGDVSFERVVPRKRKADDELERTSSRKSWSSAF